MVEIGDLNIIHDSQVVSTPLALPRTCSVRADVQDVTRKLNRFTKKASSMFAPRTIQNIHPFSGSLTKLHSFTGDSGSIKKTPGIRTIRAIGAINLLPHALALVRGF